MLATNLTRRTTSPFGSRDPFFDFADRILGNWPVFVREAENSSNQAPTWVPAVDIRETTSGFVAVADLPGLTREDIEVAIEDNVLSISGSRKLEKESENDTYHRIERAHGSFHRAFTLPRGVDTSKVVATFKDGILTLTLPKVEEVKARKIAVA